jgi:ribosomal protein S18 acetylase RimI-like enzyme
VAGLWLGNAVDQVTGERYAHIFMLYVQPAHRRRGLASALLQTAQQWARERGDQQIGLQVFPHNQAALNLYQKNGFQVHALMMLKTNLNPVH